jgi:hypothetical protein
MLNKNHKYLKRVIRYGTMATVDQIARSKAMAASGIGNQSLIQRVINTITAQEKLSIGQQGRIEGLEALAKDIAAEYLSPDGTGGYAQGAIIWLDNMSATDPRADKLLSMVEEKVGKPLRQQRPPPVIKQEAKTTEIPKEKPPAEQKEGWKARLHLQRK